ncbi:MAG: glycosyltransferase family 2 protein [Rubrivivax sp.]|nr:glycosyltransferase family 2 protein [Rubrivivax sp.]
MTLAPHCTAVILNWNGWRDTLACVDSLLQAQPAPGRIIVCDNGSADDSLVQLDQALRAVAGRRFLRTDRAGTQAVPVADADLWLVANGANLGYAGGINVGLRLALRDAGCSHAWILNNDTELAPDALAQALARMASQPDIGLCGSTLVYAHDRRTVQAWGGSAYARWSGRTRHLGAHGQLAEVPDDPAATEAAMACVVGAAMLARREWLDTVGLLSEDYFLYFEEMDWAARAAGLGGAGPRWRLGWAPRSVVFHKEGASIGTAAAGGSPLSLYYLFRNRQRFAWRFHRAFVPAVFTATLWDVFKLAARARWPQAAAALRGSLQLARQPAAGRA